MAKSIARWALLCAVLLGVVGMHHMTTSDPVMSVAVSVDGPSVDADAMAGHDLLHLCLAVLVAAVGLVVLWLLLVTGSAAVPGTRSSRFVTTPRAPPPGRLLVSLCVSRR
ncbi:hypothetical protein [Actinokineospora inagensis]|uniref:hypothetical protein n=1 Tax=Actinokineospora inagensis TaxID=103730 RepID=UPI00040ED2E8|nr:hypothetical protein [Actinokineospora inagensis]